MEERRSQRRRATDEQMERRLSSLEDRMHEVERSHDRVRLTLEDMAEATKKNNVQTEEMYEIFSDAKAGFRTLAMIGKGAKPVFMIFALTSAILLGVKTGVWKWPW